MNGHGQHTPTQYGILTQADDWGIHDDGLINMDATAQEPIRVVCDRNDILGSIVPMKVWLSV